MSDVDWTKAFAETNEEMAKRVANGEEPARAATIASRHVFQRLTGAESPGFDWEALANDTIASTAIEFGVAEKQFGPVFLHPVVFVQKDGERRLQSYYQLLFGEHGTPILLPNGTVYQGAALDLTALGSVLRESSELPDVVRHLKQIQIRKHASADFYREMQAQRRDRAADYAQRIVIAERHSSMIDEALRALEAQYPSEMRVSQIDPSPDERERAVRKMRELETRRESMSAYLRAQGVDTPRMSDEA